MSNDQLLKGSFLFLSSCSSQNDAKLMESKAVYIVAKGRRVDIKYGQEGRKFGITR